MPITPRTCLHTSWSLQCVVRHSLLRSRRMLVFSSYRFTSIRSVCSIHIQVIRFVKAQQTLTKQPSKVNLRTRKTSSIIFYKKMFRLYKNQIPPSSRFSPPPPLCFDRAMTTSTTTPPPLPPLPPPPVNHRKPEVEPVGPLQSRMPAQQRRPGQQQCSPPSRSAAP